MIEEVARAQVIPDVVLPSVGGGGLLSGVVEGLQRNRWDDVPVLAIETEGAASFHAAVEAGHPVELERIASAATSLGAKRVCEQALRCAHEHPVRSLVVSDYSALVACERFLADHRILVEPACGAALSITSTTGIRR
ncbi:pyridoxal-phosphate dependent enzyme [Paraburkholderia sp. CNPSo 3274]|uniref:pyridoxal-phosphate dependent enzyme n=1 Tax=Paraburkholderia sp. CNPSo 3274 TaxID=2940932 RepID=UPI0020B74CE1|nr:pyridoxal-phosphate dependent enzyme [Paraburkholderia sp. CNPSo 3274]MCP3708861.1 pyridoxal-phosphate dependent enzyme [Paraburkholderia sp. CNPSo 3274]